MSNYKSILTGYLNTSREGDRQYLTITNTSDEIITLEPGEKVYLNMTPKAIRDKNPKIPLFTKSVKIEEQTTESTVKDSIPPTPDEEDPF